MLDALRLEGVSSVELSLRNARALPASWRKDDQSVEAVLSTEQPVTVYDWANREAVDEVLLADGMRMPGTGQVPMQDTHARWSIDSTLGSVREVRAQRDAGGLGQVVGRLYFSSVEEDARTKVSEGHVTDVSVGYRNLRVFRIEPGQTGTVAGREFTAGRRPMHVVTEWFMREVSLAPIGADDMAKIRSAQGAPAGTTLRDVLEGVSFQTLEVVNMAKETTAPPQAPEGTRTPAPETPEAEEPQAPVLTDDEVRARGIRAIAPRGMEKLADELVCDAAVTVDEARKRFLAKLAEQTQPAGHTEPEQPERKAEDEESKRAEADKAARAELDAVPDSDLVRSLGG